MRPDCSLVSSLPGDGVVNLGAMENRLVLGVDVTNSSVNSLSRDVVLGEVTLLNSADILSLFLWSGVLNKLGRLLSELSVVRGRKFDFLKGLNLVWDFLVVSAWTVEGGVVSVSSVSSLASVVVWSPFVVAALRLMVLNELTPSMLDKVTSINLSMEDPDTSVELGLVVGLEILSGHSSDCQLSISYLGSVWAVLVSISVSASFSSASSVVSAGVTPALSSSMSSLSPSVSSSVSVPASSS